MLHNKVIGITGGTGLIGYALAKGLVEAEAKIVIGDINQEKAEKVQKELGKDNILFIPTDVTDVASINNFIEKGYKAFGKIDTLIHSAYPRSKTWGTKLEDLTAENLKEDLFNQLGSAILFSQQAIKFFRKQGYGNLIHISSIQGVSAPKFEHYEELAMSSPIEYSAIKSGVISIVKYLAKYCKGQNIRVNSLSPGGILDKQPDLFLKKYKKSCLSKGMLNQEDLIGTALYLASDMSKYVNGQNIIIDDGWSL